MIICPDCGVQLHTSDTPKNALKNHRAEQHPAVEPTPTFKDGFMSALGLVHEELRADLLKEGLEKFPKELA